MPATSDARIRQGVETGSSNKGKLEKECQSVIKVQDWGVLLRRGGWTLPSPMSGKTARSSV